MTTESLLLEALDLLLDYSTADSEGIKELMKVLPSYVPPPEKTARLLRSISILEKGKRL